MDPGRNRHQMLIRYTLPYLDFPGYIKTIFLATRAFTRDKKVKTKNILQILIWVFSMPYCLIEEGDFFCIFKYLFKALRLFFLANFTDSKSIPCPRSILESIVFRNI